ncbi:MAG TPA: YcnI family protein [Nocardioidaceae bacterium]|nr:YcnI family protein [Nocardioidaceae bacterium]
MSILNKPVRRTATRLAVALTAAGAAVVALPLAAQAHVEVQPGAVPGGDFAVVAFRVPNERDNASTTKLRVILPPKSPLGSVQTTAMPGWKVQTATRKLAKPIEMFGAKVDRVVSQVTWTATQGGVRPGQFQDFELSLGQLPKSGKLTFTAIQTYSGGEQVLWNEVSAEGAAEPEHPAPTLQITAPAEEGSSATEPASDESSSTQQANVAASSTDDGGVPVLPTVLSSAALIVALGALALAWRRSRG